MATKSLLEYHTIDTELEYRTKKGKDVVGTIFEVEIIINKYRTSIVYTVIDDLDDTHYVDGETFMQL